MRENEAPEKLYLQINDPEYGDELSNGEITWCEHRQHGTDIVYIRQDVIEKIVMGGGNETPKV